MSDVTNNISNIRVRKSGDRGHANHGWLNTYHTFSFASYYDPEFEGFGSLRVINEDRVSGGNGFGMHPHSNYEIFSIVLDGALEHRDSMGNREVIKRGAVQFTSAGKGIYHSEYNASKKDPVHFLQIWVKPDVRDIKPSYSTKEWSDEEKTNVLKKIISTDGSDGSIKIHQDISVFTSILEKKRSLNYALGKGRVGYLHLAQTSGGRSQLTLNGSVELAEGDGAFLFGPLELEVASTFDNDDSKPAEFVFFDLAASN